MTRQFDFNAFVNNLNHSLASYRYNALTSQTTKTITTRVPISPYPNIVASSESEIFEFRIRRDPLCTMNLNDVCSIPDIATAVCRTGHKSSDPWYIVLAAAISEAEVYDLEDHNMQS